MIRRPPRSTRLTHSFPTRRSSDLTPRVASRSSCATAYRRSTRMPARALSNSRSITGTQPRIFPAHSLRVSKVRALIPCKRSFRSRRSEEHTSELQSLMRNTYAVFCLKKKQQIKDIQHKRHNIEQRKN